MSKLSRDLNNTKRQKKQAAIKQKAYSKIVAIKMKIWDITESIDITLNAIEDKISQIKDAKAYEKKVNKSVKKLVQAYSKMKDNYLLNGQVEILKKDGCILGKVDDFYFRSYDKGELSFYEVPRYEWYYDKLKDGKKTKCFYANYNVIEINLSPLSNVIKKMHEEKKTVFCAADELSNEALYEAGDFHLHKDIDKELNMFKQTQKQKK